MPFMRPLDVAFDNGRSIVVDVSHIIIWDIDEWDVVEVPLVVIQASEVRFMVEKFCGLQV